MFLLPGIGLAQLERSDFGRPRRGGKKALRAGLHRCSCGSVPL